MGVGLATVYLLSLFFGATTSVQKQIAPKVEKLFTLWKSGDVGDVSHYRIPIATWNSEGTVVVVAEARKLDSSDASAKFLAMRRASNVTSWSEEAWSPTSFIENDGFARDGANLGAVLSDEINGSTILLFGTCQHECPESTSFTMTSFDGGITWGLPVNISHQIGHEVFAGGPGYGIQKKYEPHRGRLIFCGWNCSGPIYEGLCGNTTGVKCIYSDDGGVKWKQGAWLPGIPFGESRKIHDFEASENQLVELSDGSILISMRNGLQFDSSARILARSFDAIETISMGTIKVAKDLVSPGCAGSLLYVEEHDLLLHSNPYHASERINMTLSWSWDRGRTWAGRTCVYPGPSGYSTLIRIPGDGNRNRVGLIYENGEASTYEYISMALIDLHIL